MFANLEAEQARHGHTNEFVANKLKMSRRTFEIKKQKGTFKLPEIKKLMEMYGKDFFYLFEERPRPA